MGRSKKHKPGEIKVISYSPRRPLYLLENPLSVLPIRQLPTNGHILRYFLYVNAPRDKRFKPLKSNFSCSQQTGQRNMICKGKDGPCNDETGKYCILRSVVNIWASSGFKDYLISEQSIADKFLAIYSQYKSVCKENNLIVKKNTSEKHKEKFLCMTEDLFDISSRHFEDLMRHDTSMPRDSVTIAEDLEFIKDQRNERKMIISAIIDKELEAKVQRRIDRYKRLQEYQARILADEETQPEVYVDDNTDDYETQPCDDANERDYTSIVDSYESEDEPAPKRIRERSKSGKIL